MKHHSLLLIFNSLVLIFNSPLLNFNSLLLIFNSLLLIFNSLLLIFNSVLLIFNSLQVKIHSLLLIFTSLLLILNSLLLIFNSLKVKIHSLLLNFNSLLLNFNGPQTSAVANPTSHRQTLKAWNINSDMKFEMSLVLRHLSPPLQKLLTLMQLSWRKLFPTCSPSIQLSQVNINLLSRVNHIVNVCMQMIIIRGLLRTQAPRSLIDGG